MSELNINLFNILIGFGMLQGFVFGILLIYKSKYRKAHKYLGLTVLFLSFYLLWVLKYDYGIQENYPFLQLLPILFLWGIGPAFYIFIRFSVGKSIAKKEIGWHFAPVVIEWLYFNSCTLIYWSNNWGSNSLSQLEVVWVNKFSTVDHIVGLISIGIYLLMSFRLLFKNKMIISTKIRYVFYCFAILWCVWLPYSIFDIWFYNFRFPPSGFYAFYILFSALTYCMGFVGFKLDYSPVGKRKLMDMDENLMLFNKIKKTMQNEKYYLDPDITLIKFSKHLNVSSKKISSIINNEFKVSFRDFINSYRIDEFKSKLNTEDLKKVTLMGVAYDVGFNSKASFNRIFKKETGMTPNQYLKSLTKNESQN